MFKQDNRIKNSTKSVLLLQTKSQVTQWFSQNKISHYWDILHFFCMRISGSISVVAMCMHPSKCQLVRYVLNYFLIWRFSLSWIAVHRERYCQILTL